MIRTTQAPLRSSAAMIELSQAISALPEEGASDKLRENLKDTIDYINAHILTNVDGRAPGQGKRAEDSGR